MSSELHYTNRRFLHFTFVSGYQSVWQNRCQDSHYLEIFCDITSWYIPYIIWYII